MRKPLVYKNETVWYRGKLFDWECIVSFMQDEVRESLHRELAPCSNEDFLEGYLAVCPEFAKEYDGCLYPLSSVYATTEEDLEELSKRFKLEDCGGGGYYSNLHWFSDVDGHMEIYTS